MWCYSSGTHTTRKNNSLPIHNAINNITRSLEVEIAKRKLRIRTVTLISKPRRSNTARIPDKTHAYDGDVLVVLLDYSDDNTYQIVFLKSDSVPPISEKTIVARYIMPYITYLMSL
jgi:hypothetical protein